MSKVITREHVERWLIHSDMSFKDIKDPDNTFHILIKHAGAYGVPVEVFEPKKQAGILVIGAKVIMKNNQIQRYIRFSEKEKEKFKENMSKFCHSVQAINKFITKDGKEMIGVYIVLDDKENINQQTMLDGINSVVEKYEKISRFLLKTF